MSSIVISVLLLQAMSTTAWAQRTTENIPHLENYGTATQLVVQNKPFLMLGGELGNSSASNLEYLKPCWQNFKKMHLNTLLVPLYWEFIEPAEGKYDFALVDSIIISARRSDLKLVFLWFGSWKNSMSCYIPSWMKHDQNRFPRARTKEGKALEILTPFSDENMNADAHAFAAFMRHVRSVDRNEQTVLMVQVENEIGMIPEARDYSTIANTCFTQQVPTALMNYINNNKETLGAELVLSWQHAGSKNTGTWEEVFGRDLQTDEIFMAWYFARYTNFVAEAGKKEYPLPMYVNAALIRPGYKPGQYPSAGPLPHLLDIWRAAAPHIDFFAPDIYFKNFAEWCTKFDHSGNPLFIPEVGNDQNMSNAFYAFAQHNAMGYSPFSIESLEQPDNNQVCRGYEILTQLTPLILEHQGQGSLAGVLLDSIDQREKIALGNYVFTVKHEYSWSYAVRSEGAVPRVGGMIINLSPDEFLIAGTGIIVTFEASPQMGTIAGIDQMEEGTYIHSQWIAGRRMNGDQSHQGRHMYLPGKTFTIQKVKLYQYK
jgi:hypothetical protein